MWIKPQGLKENLKIESKIILVPSKNIIIGKD